MDDDIIVAAVLVTIAAVIPVVTLFVSDKRHFRNPRSVRFFHRGPLQVWREIDSDPAFDQGWFSTKFRCVFDVICSRIDERWAAIHTRRPATNSIFKIRDRVSVTLFYLTHPTSYEQAGSTFGTSKTRSTVYIHQVIDVVNSFFDATVAGLALLHGRI